VCVLSPAALQGGSHRPGQRAVDLRGGQCAAELQEKHAPTLLAILIAEHLPAVRVPVPVLERLLATGGVANTVTPSFLRHHFRGGSNGGHPSLSLPPHARFLLSYLLYDLSEEGLAVEGGAAIMGLPLIPLANGSLSSSELVPVCLCACVPV
jgi:hypothetical protein